MIGAKIKIYLFSLLSAVFMSAAGRIMALENTYPTILGMSLNSESTLPELVAYFLNIGISIAAFGAVLAIAFGGISYLVSYTRGKFTDEGKEWIKSGTLGMAITACVYLFLYTINPELVNLKVRQLLDIPLKALNPDSQPQDNTGAINYAEIPIGKLVETLLTRTMDNCDGFDLIGDPVKGDSITTDRGKQIDGPLYFNKDRVFCLLQYMDGAKKKAELAKNLSEEIKKLMDQCDCAGKCDNDCSSNDKEKKPKCNEYNGQCPAVGFVPECSGDCAKNKCKPFKGEEEKDCCPEDSGIQDPDDETRNLTVKEQIEHGPVKVPDPICWEEDDKKENPASFDQNRKNVFTASLMDAYRRDKLALLAENNNAEDPGDQEKKKVVFFTTYAHMDKIYVSLGQNINKGDHIGQVGKVGAKGGGAYPHMHFAAGLVDPKGVDSISFNIYPSVSLANKIGARASGVPGPVDIPKELYTKEDIINILSLIGPPVPLSHCSWKEVYGSLLHSGYAYWAQDWACQTDALTDKSPAIAMAGDGEVKSTVVAINPSVGNVVIRHEFTPKSETSPFGKEYQGLDEFRCPDDHLKYNQCENIAGIVEEQHQYHKKTITVINREKWDDLNITQQLRYFEEKIKKIQSEIQDDGANLAAAANMLGSEKCYFAASYIDLMKRIEQTDQDDYIIIPQRPFSDPKEGKPIEIAKYCAGFNYGNSSCLKKCGDECPDDSLDVLSGYYDCGECGEDDYACMENQHNCIMDVFNQRPCLYGKDESQTFEGCIEKCRGDCKADCKKNFLECSDEYKACEAQCSDDSKCVLDNADKCLLNSQSFKDCADKATDEGNAEFCIENAYLCKYGSDQYSGYGDCVSGNDSYDPQKYSSSYLFKNPGNQKCQDPYNESDGETYCYSEGEACGDVCPETLKCPNASFCPDCPCGEVKENYLKSGEEDGDESSANNSGDGPFPVHRVVSPECVRHSYNDDPMTFYCESRWWLDPEITKSAENPIGNDMIAPKEREIPVGQTVDDAKDWAQKVIKSAELSRRYIEATVDFLENWIGKAKDREPVKKYCKCEAKYEDASPICSTDCEFSQTVAMVDDTDDEGNVIGQHEEWTCSCSFVPCKGSPCQQIIDYLKLIKLYHGKLKEAYGRFYEDYLLEGRSDVLKELAYSRQKINECSIVGNSYIQQAMMLNCTRVKDEIVSSTAEDEVIFGEETVQSYCYGKDLGKLYEKNITDNWFCLEQRATDDNGPNIGQTETDD